MDRQAVRETEEEAKRKGKKKVKQCQKNNTRGKRGNKKVGRERRAGGGQKDEEWLEPKRQPLHLSPLPLS